MKPVPVTIEIGDDLDNLNKRMKFIFNVVYMLMHMQESGFLDITDSDICGFLEETGALEKDYAAIQKRLIEVGKAS